MRRVGLNENSEADDIYYKSAHCARNLGSICDDLHQCIMMFCFFSWVKKFAWVAGRIVTTTLPKKNTHT